MNCKKLIEVAMPVKEISAESVRDKSIRHGHISTLHLWWARRPLPVCRAVVFASLVPDPLDENCPIQFREAVATLLASSIYKPYDDIPYTASNDPMEDNLRNRLLMFIGKYSRKFIQVEKSGKGSCATKETLESGCLINWDNKNNESILNIARKLIFVAHNSSSHSEDRSDEESHSHSITISNNKTYNNSPLEMGTQGVCKTCDELLDEFDEFYSAIKTAETNLYETPDRHLQTDEIKQKEEVLHNAIEAFLDKMPKVYDPFAGGGAIPLESARLGCKTFANDLNPVAHIIEKASVEYPQKYGKPITYSVDEFIKNYGEEEFHKQNELKNVFGNNVNIKNQLTFDVEYFAKKLFQMSESEIGHLYAGSKNKNTIGYHIAYRGICKNPSCRKRIPLISSFNLCQKDSKTIYLHPIIKDNSIAFSIKSSIPKQEPFVQNKSLTCPFCGSITSKSDLKNQFINKEVDEIIIDVIDEGKIYRLPFVDEIDRYDKIEINEKPIELLVKNDSKSVWITLWGFEKWGDLYTNRQIQAINTLIQNFHKLAARISIITPNQDYIKAINCNLSILINRIASRLTKCSIWNTTAETIEIPFGNKTVPLYFDFIECNPFSDETGGGMSQLNWIIKYIEGESITPFSCICSNTDASNNKIILNKYIDSTITDPPYYDAIGYADLSDLFYIWFKRTLNNTFSEVFSYPLSPKSQECTALKHHHSNDTNKAKSHFENKLTQIFSVIENQTNDIVSIMFAHQSTEAWTTLCNSILNSRMNITGSWAIDTERTSGTKTNKAFLASSVTVTCKPAQRQGTGDSKEVKAAIEQNVKNEVEELYKLGFRGADLLTACFGPAVSEFGKYERVEKASGEEVTVEELLTWAKDAAFNAIVTNIPSDDFTRFYIGYLNLFGFTETEHDDVKRITQIGLHLDVNDLLANHLLIRNGNKQTLANYLHRAEENKKLGELRDSYTIDKVHKAMHLLGKNNRRSLLSFIAEHAQNQEDIFWRVANSLFEVLPKGMEDQKRVAELLANKDNLIKDSKSATSKLGEQGDMFN